MTTSVLRSGSKSKIVRSYEAVAIASSLAGCVAWDAAGGCARAAVVVSVWRARRVKIRSTSNLLGRETDSPVTAAISIPHHGGAPVPACSEGVSSDHAKSKLEGDMELQGRETQTTPQLSRVDAAPLRSSEPRPTIAFAKDAAGFVAILQPLWVTPPSPEALCVRIPQAALASISDLDVRALKSPYTPGTNTNGSGYGTSAAPPNSGPGSPGLPGSPVVDGGSSLGTFTVEASALRVQALIADDRALMERVIRFAQAHDLLKKNAEHAQKLAQDSNAALETYQRQVRTLEEQLASSDGLYAPLSPSSRTAGIYCLDRQEQVDQLAAEKLAVEERAAEQAETLRELTEANAVLSARALQLAEDAAAVQEELRAVNTASEREQTQRLALLEEINLVQTENGSLRQQLRALGKL
ncbi:hypothetical protein EDB85DRAFT_2276832 [Lactarius pseudohatsudake]|nr:hypothetical protein EDB85DRAFT_2276832 [Lactarius pseudohatsudake]